MILGLLLSCTPKKTFIPSLSSISQVNITDISKVAFPNAIIYPLSASFAIPNVDWIVKEYYQEFRKELFNKGVVNWDVGFNCNQFARYYTSYLQTKFFIENFHLEKAPTLAVGSLCYLIDGDRNKSHEINCIVNEYNQIILIEPQNGKIVSLTDKEKNSVFLILW